VVLGPVVCLVVGAWVPKKLELALGLETLQPVESHVHGFCVGAVCDCIQLLGLCCCQFAWKLGTVCGPFLQVFGIVG
jgi:hypothetical protein